MQDPIRIEVNMSDAIIAEVFAKERMHGKPKTLGVEIFEYHHLRSSWI